MSETTTVVNIKSGERYDVYIGRTMPHGNGKYMNRGWGNPFHAHNLPHGYANAVDAYRDWLLGKGAFIAKGPQKHLLAKLPQLKGLRLGCWCHPDGCHGDVLAELADATEGASASHAPLVLARTPTDTGLDIVAPRPCRTCNEPVLDIAHERTSTPAPIDLTPNPDGPVTLNYAVDGRTVVSYHVLSATERAGSITVPRYTNHWQTCRDRKAWQDAYRHKKTHDTSAS